MAEVIADVGDDAVGKWIAEHGVRLAVLQGAHVERDEQGEGDVVGKRELLVADGIVELCGEVAVATVGEHHDDIAAVDAGCQLEGCREGCA